MSLIKNQFGELVVIQILLIFVTLLHVIFTKNVEPVEFLLSKNSPRNKTLYIPKPKEFKFLGDTNDCCVISLFIQVKGLVILGSGNEAEPSQIDDNEAPTENGQVTFKFDHPQIRNDSKTFTMDINDETVSKRHLIHFDNCGTITQVIFFVYANTNITEDKDIRIVVLDGKDNGILCTPIPTPKYEPLPTPKHEKDPKSEPITSTDPTLIILSVATTFSTFVSLILFALVVYVINRYVIKKKKQTDRNEKFMGGDSDYSGDDIKESFKGGDDDDKENNYDIKEKSRGLYDDDNENGIELQDLPNTTSSISLGGNNSRYGVTLGVNEHDMKMSDRLDRWLAKLETYKKKLFITCIVSSLLTVVLVIILLVFFV